MFTMMNAKLHAQRGGARILILVCVPRIKAFIKTIHSYSKIAEKTRTLEHTLASGDLMLKALIYLNYQPLNHGDKDREATKVSQFHVFYI
jgi:hypothetical protein